MHAMIFLPATVFCAVAAACWLMGAVIDQRATGAARHRPAAAVPAPPPARFRPIIIEGGLQTAPRPAAGYFRPSQTPVRSRGVATAARSYGG